MDNKVRKFELSSKDVKVKELLNKDFLELEFKAISTANPNRNGSHFTLESMQKALPTFYNKPILGSFSVNHDDFRGHEGDLEYDPELDTLYYDYTDDTSEVPLGMIRGTDRVEIVHDKKDGLDWIKFTCVIWVKYNYKQVKSLLKSKDGKKKISVEVEVNDMEFDENGVEIIKDFTFDGCTILGDHLETGIADAELTILDKIESALFQKKQKCLAFAYNALDKVETPDNIQDSNKQENFKGSSDDSVVNESPEEEITMEDQEKPDNQESEERREHSLMKDELQNSVEITEEVQTQEFAEEVCPECGKNPCECEAKKEEEACESKEEESKCGCEAKCEAEAKEEEACGEKLEEAEEVCPDCGKNPCECESKCECEAKEEGTEENFEAEAKEEFEMKDPWTEADIRRLLISEEEAINEYTYAYAWYSEENPLVAEILKEIKEDEEKHVGCLTQVLQMLNDETIDHLEDGIEEAQEIIVEAVLEGEEKAEEENAPVMFDKDEPDDDDDKDDDKDDDDDDANEENFAEVVEPNEEPSENRLPDSIEEGVAEATASISAPEVQMERPEEGTVVTEEVSQGPAGEMAEQPQEGAEQEGEVEQPDDKAKEFSTENEVDVADLMAKYAALQEQFNTLSQSVKAQEALTLAEFGKNFIDSDEYVPEDVRNEYSAQVAEKCNNFEFTTEEEVIKFAKSLLAMYYYENKIVVKANEEDREFNINLQKQTIANTQASKLKDAINKLNHTN